MSEVVVIGAGVSGLAAATGAAVGDTLYFAGEATATDGWTGTVAGAIESGRRAAREIPERVRGAGNESAGSADD